MLVSHSVPMVFSGAMGMEQRAGMTPVNAV